MPEINKLIYTLKQIETPRLVIRPVQLGDEVEINKAINNSLKVLQKWQPWAQDPSLETTRLFVERGVFSWSSACIKDFPMVVIHKQDERIIGASGYNDRSNPDNGLYEIGYWCDVDYQGQGLVTEYTNALTRFAFDVLSASKVVITMLVENKKSSAVAIRLNFTKEGIKERDPLDCAPEQTPKDYLYSATNTEKLPALDYSWLADKNDSQDFKIIQWARKIFHIVDEKSFAKSRAVAKTPWSTVFEINAGNNIYYLKRTPELFSKEANIIQFLNEHTNASVPEVVGINPEFNCFLMKNAGETLRKTLKKDFNEQLVLNTIEQFTSLQIESAKHIDALLKIGVPDYRLDNLPELYNKIIDRKDFLLSEGVTKNQIDQLIDLSSTVCQLCHSLASYKIKETIVQPDFNDNNTLVDQATQKLTVIDLGEIVISHPFFSLTNFLFQIKKHHGLSEDSDLYQRIESACFEKYQQYFNSSDDLYDALATTNLVQVIYYLVDQERFIRACGADNLNEYGHRKMQVLCELFITSCKNRSKA